MNDKERENLYGIIKETVGNVIMQNADEIDRKFEIARKLAEDPSALVFPLNIKVEMSRVIDATDFNVEASWEVKDKEKIKTPVETYDPNQPGLFDKEE